MDKIEGKLVHVGDDISADLILPSRWVLTPPETAAQHILEDLDPALPQLILDADLIVAGRNFGSGTGREATLRAIKAAGIQAIITHSAARLFFRNAINNGILVIQTPEVELMRSYGNGSSLSIDLQASHIVGEDGRTFSFAPIPPAIIGIVDSGGIESYGAAFRK